MPSPSLVDINSLLEPISPDNAAGADPRKDISPTSAYSLIRDARKSARATERINLFDGNTTQADEFWRKVLDIAPKILKSQAKDLEVACWYTEALIRKAGFQGLRDGFEIIRQLIDKYWDGLYPLPDDDGIETRVAPVAGLNGEGAEGVLLAPMRSTAITGNTQAGQFSLWQYKQALDIQRITDGSARSEQSAKLGFALSDIQKAVDQTSETFYVNLRDDLNACLEIYRDISQKLVEHCGTQHTPPTSNIIGLLEETIGVINHVAKNKLPAANAGNNSAEGTTTGGAATGMHATGPIKSREEAFRQLQHISLFFRSTEPHSPISYVIEKAVKWGNMSLGELVRELIPDDQARDIYSSLTGVTTNAGNSRSEPTISESATNE